MSHTTKRLPATNHINPSDLFYSFDDVDDTDNGAEVELRLPALPDLIEVEDLRDEVDGDQIYVQQLVSEYESQQFND